MDEALASCLSLPETMSSFPETAQFCLPTGHLLQHTLGQYEGGAGGDGDGNEVIEMKKHWMWVNTGLYIGDRRNGAQ